MLADVDETKANEAVKELRLAGYDAVCVVGIALDKAFLAKAVDAALETFEKVNCLINNAGTTITISPHFQRQYSQGFVMIAPFTR